MQYVIVRLAAAAVLGCSAAASLAQVTPPPLPPGSHLVRVEPGMAEPERKRAERAHHHKAHHKKDYTRDDSVPGHQTHTHAPATAAPLGGPPAARPAGADAGRTGPAREQNGRGAASYFYDHGNKK